MGYTWDILSLLPQDGNADKITVYYDEINEMYMIKQRGKADAGIYFTQKQFDELKNSMNVFKPGPGWRESIGEAQGKKKEKTPYEKVRKPTAPPTQPHKNKDKQKDKWSRKAKHKGKQMSENTMSFKELVKLVIESGGQQKITPLDDALWDWAERVAATKVESKKQEMYTGLLYERYGGKFDLKDVLSED